MHEVNLQLILIYMLQMHVSTNLVLPSCDDGGEYDSLGFDEYVGEYGLGENGYLE